MWIWFCCVLFLLIYTHCVLLPPMFEDIFCVWTHILWAYICGNWGLGENVFLLGKYLSCLLLPGSWGHYKPRITLSFRLEFLSTHNYEALLPRVYSPRFGERHLHCLFLLVAFFQFSHFRTSPTGNPSFMWRSSIQPPCPFRPQVSTRVLCILLSHQRWTDVPKQTPAPPGIFLKRNFLLVSDNFPSFSDNFVMPFFLKKDAFCISSSISSACTRRLSPDSYCWK